MHLISNEISIDRSNKAGDAYTLCKSGLVGGCVRATAVKGDPGGALLLRLLSWAGEGSEDPILSPPPLLPRPLPRARGGPREWEEGFPKEKGPGWGLSGWIQEDPMSADPGSGSDRRSGRRRRRKQEGVSSLHMRRSLLRIALSDTQIDSIQCLNFAQN